MSVASEALIWCVGGGMVVGLWLKVMDHVDVWTHSNKHQVNLGLILQLNNVLMFYCQFIHLCLTGRAELRTFETFFKDSTRIVALTVFMFVGSTIILGE
jgi:hypothetical protein